VIFFGSLGLQKGACLHSIRNRPISACFPIAVQINRLSKQSEENGIEGKEVAELVCTALSALEPRSRYIVGRGAPLTMLMKRLLPDRVWDPILQSSLRQEQVEL
jgi:hypothetical protein